MDRAGASEAGAATTDRRVSKNSCLPPVVQLLNRADRLPPGALQIPGSVRPGSEQIGTLRLPSAERPSKSGRLFSTREFSDALRVNDGREALDFALHRRGTECPRWGLEHKRHGGVVAEHLDRVGRRVGVSAAATLNLSGRRVEARRRSRLWCGRDRASIFLPHEHGVAILHVDRIPWRELRGAGWPCCRQQLRACERSASVQGRLVPRERRLIPGQLRWRRRRTPRRGVLEKRSGDPTR